MNYLYNPYFWNPPIPNIDLYPPTIYSLLESIVNYGKDDKTKIKDLAKVGRLEIFDFEYPLTDNITKEDFEVQILNHYLMRRIGFETLTAFKIGLNCKLNEIMPLYNKMFDSLENWNIFGDELTVRSGNDKMVSSEINNSNTQTNASSNASSNSTSDRRFSDTPQDKLEDVRAGDYVTNYSYDTDSVNSGDSSVSTGNSNSNTNRNDDKNYNETISKSLTGLDKIEILKQMQVEINSIYSLIYKNLDDLFYDLV